MRIGLYCGLANNMYLFGHGLAKRGIDVCFIRDRSDRYPMSQPVWEDIAFSMEYAEVPRAAYWPWDKWDEFERARGWRAPCWLYDPLPDAGGNAAVSPSVGQGYADSLFLKRYARVPHRAPVLRKMRECDALMVSGIEGSVLANASGRPFIIYPFGGDLMIAAGLLRPKPYHVRSSIMHFMVRRQLVIAYANAVCVASHEPTALATDFYGAERFLRKHKVARITLPFITRSRAEPDTRRQQLARLLSEMGLKAPSSRFVGFVPSRVDYEWKGQDRLLRAFSRLASEGKVSDLHLIFSGWGQDFENARKFVQDQGLVGRITFLDCALSKPLLYQFYLAADFVVDQFIVGMCGTSALEAMACGAPLITWINTAVERSWGLPPVLQARTEDEIAAVLADISAERIDLPGVGACAREWIARNYDTGTATTSLLTEFSRQ